MAKNRTNKTQDTTKAITEQAVKTPETEQAVKTPETIDEMFKLGSKTVETGRGIHGAAELNAYAATLARKTIETAMTRIKAGQAEGADAQTVIEAKDIKSRMDEVLDIGEYSSTVSLIEMLNNEPIKCDALAACTEDELARLLESRRSDRSKTKKKGLRTSAVIMLQFFAATIAEIAIRNQSGKAYVASNGSSFNANELALDQDALNKKIRSLQSKQSNLRRALKYIPDGVEAPEREQLKQVQAQIAELQSKRTGASTRTVTTTVPSKADLSAAIASMTEEEKLALIAQLQSAAAQTQQATA